MMRWLLTLLLLLAAPAMAAEEGAPIVIGKSYTLQSKLLGDKRTINVYLPAGYADPGKRFAVLYLLDGGAQEDFHHISGIAQVAAFSGRTQELIVVGIQGVDRKHDLTYPSADPRDRKGLPTSGGSALYRRFLVEEVKPWVEARYRTNGRSALIGESLAGLFTLETYLRAPASFDDYIVSSPSLWWDRETLSKEAAADLKRGNFAGHRLYLGVPNEGPEMKLAHERVVAGLKAAGATYRYDPRPDERHDSIYHPAALAGVRWLFDVPEAKKP